MEQTRYLPFDEIPVRLKAERNRLSLSQQQFADLGGVSRKSQMRYENSITTLDMAYLRRLSLHGVDVLYVLTGQCNTPEEAHLLSIFNAAPAAVQVAVLAALRASQPY